MSRTIDSATIAALATNSFAICTLVQFDFDATLRLTDWNRTVSALSTTWPASSHFLGMSEVVESSELRVNSISLEFSGVEQSFVALLLGGDYIDVRTRVWRAVLNSADAVIGAPILAFDGRITSYTITDSESESTVQIECASHWKDFELSKGRRTNHNSQQLYFPGDLGFEFAPYTTKDMKWGRK